MSNNSKLEFVALDISSKGYSSRILDAEIHLDVMGLVDTIKDNNQASSQDRAKAMIFLRHHLDEGLKMQYLTIKDPLILEDVTEHAKLEKTHSTFPASSMLLQQYREMGFKKYSELLSHLIVEQHNDRLMKNHESYESGNYHQRERGHGSDRGSGHKINYNHDGHLAQKND
ncbi:hypothetical protein R3W88_025481 [Solanum pinnatisectum]|uniref:Uncharacterized protein n=1 Tax=Solanum pinnatisectum TaxID=50273 RepID=A0AAV9M3X5_9SOLN|nr:hypothetical protein R3W88_025481 [Solanum pinnatisectum]